MSFFAELKRRNVFKVAAAYIIVAWLIMQAGDTLAPALHLPEWVNSLLAFFLILGFPLALFFAWAFEMTPEGIKREKDVDRTRSITQVTGQKLNYAIIALLVAALGYFVWESRFADKTETGPESLSQNPAGLAQPGSDHYSQKSPGQTTNPKENSALTPVEATPTSAEAGPATSKSVAVLPFVNMSSDPEQEYFSDGITEEIINALVKIPGLSVPARTSVFGFKGHQGDVRNIGEQLGVAHILEGSIRSQGNQVRITAQLIKVDDGFHLWSETYDRKLVNIFLVQEEIAEAIATVLTGELGLGVVTVPNKTGNMEAYDAYLQGRALLHKRGDLDQAVTLFKRATELDPQFAPAWAAMALTYTVMDLTPELLDEAIDTAKHALSLDPQNVDALDALASALRDSWQWSEAAPYFEQAMTIDPQSTELLEDYAEFLGMTGRFDQYLSTAREGYAIDPLLGPLADAFVMALTANGQYARAIEVIEEWNRLTGQSKINPWWYEPYWKMAPLMASGDDAGAIAMAKRLGPDIMPEPISNAIIALLEKPANEKARDVLRTAIGGENTTYYDSNAWMANLVLIHAGDIDFVIDDIISDSQKFSFGNIEDIWSPNWAKLRQHPRFAEYLELLNLPGYWDQAGWPDICQRIDAKRIKCE